MKRCKKHKQYKAIRKPTADCQDCRDMYEEKQATHTAGQKQQAATN